jgi:hypothetical protein
MKNKRIMSLILHLISIAMIQIINLNHKNIKLHFLLKVLRIKLNNSRNKQIRNKLLQTKINYKIILLNQSFLTNHKHHKIK